MIRASVAHSAFVFAFLMLPVFAHAGFFTAIFGLMAEAGSEDSVEIENAQNAQTVPLLRGVMNADPNAARGGGDIIVDEDGTLVPSGLGGGDDIENDGEINTYVVREGDSISQIAEMFGVSVNTILWANEVTNINTIQPGDTLVILPVSGVSHIVKKGDTLKSIAQKYQGDVDDIIAYNQLRDASDITPGQTVVIPGGEVVEVKVAKKPGTTAKGVAKSGAGGSSYYKRPLPSVYPRTQGIHGYNGVDIGAPIGSEVHAAASGSVILVRTGGGWNGGYGNYVVIKHPNGTQTLYAHLSSSLVSVGSQVTQGQAIGYSGNTGRSTGPHLHFEVRGAKNPF